MIAFPACPGNPPRRDVGPDGAAEVPTAQPERPASPGPHRKEISVGWGDNPTGIPPRGYNSWGTILDTSRATRRLRRVEYGVPGTRRAMAPAHSGSSRREPHTPPSRATAETEELSCVPSPRSSSQRVRRHDEHPVPDLVRDVDHAKIPPGLGLTECLPRATGRRSILAGTGQDSLHLGLVELRGHYTQLQQSESGRPYVSPAELAMLNVGQDVYALFADSKP
jgi:hypothetical protein